MPSPPAHASPCIAPRPIHPQRVDEYSLTHDSPRSIPNAITASDDARSNTEDTRHMEDGYISSTPALPTSIISPAFTPPATPGNGTANTTSSFYPSILSPQPGVARHIQSKPPRLLPRLPTVECIVRARIPTTTGAEMFLHLYQNDADNKEHLAIVFGNSIRSRSLDRVRPGETEMDRMIRGAYVGRLRPGRISSRFDDSIDNAGSSSNNNNNNNNNNNITDTGIESAAVAAPLVRIHSECYTGETAWSARCDCGEQLDEAARLMSEPTPTSTPNAEDGPNASGAGGVIVYLRQEGRGIGLGEKLKAYNLQDLGSDTVEANLLLRHPADARSYGLATAILVDLGLGEDSSHGGIRLLTNNPDKIAAVEGPNREIVVKERVPMVPIAWRTAGQRGIKSAEIEGYLRTKIGKMGHMLG